MIRTVKAVKVVSDNRPLEEWALRQGMSIAAKHLPDNDFESRGLLACDIAAALQNIRDCCKSDLNLAEGGPDERAERARPGDGV